MKVVIILSNQRSGSTTLLQKIHKKFHNEACVYEEIFLKQPTSFTKELYPEMSYLLPECRYYEQSDPVKNYLEKIGEKKLLIFKIMLDQIDNEILDFINTKNIELIFFDRPLWDSSISSAKIKLNLNKAHSVLRDGTINRNKKNKLNFFVYLLSAYYFFRGFYLKLKLRKLIKKSKIFNYPNFDQTINYIDENIIKKI